jgi:hypothetical protein
MFAAGKTVSLLEGLFIESPRMSEETTSQVFAKSSLPRLKVFCACRAPELRLEHLFTIPKDAQVRISDCEQLQVRHGARLKHMGHTDVIIN